MFELLPDTHPIESLDNTSSKQLNINDWLKHKSYTRYFNKRFDILPYPTRQDLVYEPCGKNTVHFKNNISILVYQRIFNKKLKSNLNFDHFGQIQN